MWAGMLLLFMPFLAKKPENITIRAGLPYLLEML
jgi:hypothetical protein